MTDNTIKKDTKAEDGQIIERAQKRLKNARLKNLRKGLKGGWRRIALGFGVNVRYVFDLAVHGVVPPNPDTRRKLGLPRVMPSERKPRKRREVPKIGQLGWEKVYFKK